MDKQAHVRQLNEIADGQLAEPPAHEHLITTREEYGAPHAGTPTRTRRWSTRALVAASFASFTCGALVWHMIGFWSFVSGIVFNPDRDPSEIDLTVKKQQIAAASDTTRPPPPLYLPPPETGTASVPGPKASGTVDGSHRPPANTETLTDLLQCAEARKGEAAASVQACPPMRRRLPHTIGSARGNRQLDAREAARRLSDGWQTGVATIETGSLPKRR